MDIEYLLLCSVTNDGNVSELIESALKPEFFNDAGHRAVYELILGHWKSYGSPAGFPEVQAAYPNFAEFVPDQPLRYYVERLKDRQLHRIGVRTLNEALLAVDSDGPFPGRELVELIRKAVQDAISEVPVGRDFDYFSQFADTVLPRLTERMTNPGYLRGIPTGFDSIDRVTGGLQPQQLVTLVGTPKSGKSTMLLNMALAAKRHGENVLFFTFEMTAEEQEDRLASLVSGVSLNKILSGTLSKVELEKITKEHRLRKSMQGLTIVSDSHSVTTVSAIQAKARHYRPSVVFVDGVYMMDDEQGELMGSPRALTNITRSLKRVAQNDNIPIVCTTQALLSRSKGGVDLGSIGYSSSFGQDSDVVFASEPLTFGLGPNISKFKVIAQRSGPKVDTFVNIDWDQGLIEEMDPVVAEATLAGAPAAGGTQVMSSNAPTNQKFSYDD